MVISGATLVDGTGADPIPDAVVVVDGQRIVYAGGRDGAPDTTGAEVVDGRGRTLFPGFIDCHVHLCFVTGTDDLWNPTISEPRMLVYAKMLRNLKVTLEAGVTSVRDMFGMDAGFVQAIEQGLVPGPRLQTSVSGITARGGHFDFRFPAGYDPVPDVLAPDSFISIVSGPDEARDATRRAIAAGASVIKIAATGGVVSPADSYKDVGLTADEVAAIVDVAATHQGGIRVAAHAEGTAGAEVALRAGVTSLEHGSDLTDEQRAFMVEHGVFLVPTLIVNRVPAPGEASDVVIAKAQDQVRMAFGNFPKAVAAGVRFAMGTDAGLSPKHGENLRELSLMIDHGATAMQAVVAGTRTGAQLLGTDADLGTVEAGKLADLVLADGDAAADLESVVRGLPESSNIALVVQDGRIVADRRT